MHKDVFETKSFSEIDLNTVTEMVVVDVCRWDRLETNREFYEKRGTHISIWDHHAEDGDIEAAWRCHKPIV